MSWKWAFICTGNSREDTCLFCCLNIIWSFTFTVNIGESISSFLFQFDPFIFLIATLERTYFPRCLIDWFIYFHWQYERRRTFLGVLTWSTYFIGNTRENIPALFSQFDPFIFTVRTTEDISFLSLFQLLIFTGNTIEDMPSLFSPFRLIHEFTRGKDILFVSVWPISSERKRSKKKKSHMSLF